MGDGEVDDDPDWEARDAAFGYDQPSSDDEMFFDIPADADLLAAAEEAGLCGDVGAEAADVNAGSSVSELPPLEERRAMADRIAAQKMFLVRTPWGCVRYYRLGTRMVGESDAFGRNVKCHLTRTTRPIRAAGIDPGRPVGVIVAWLKKTHELKDQGMDRDACVHDLPGLLEDSPDLVAAGRLFFESLCVPEAWYISLYAEQPAA